MKQHRRKERSITPESPDIELTADVKARELRFDEVPETEVHPPAQTERENLPEQVRPEHEGVTFRDKSLCTGVTRASRVRKPDRRQKRPQRRESD